MDSTTYGINQKTSTESNNMTRLEKEKEKGFDDSPTLSIELLFGEVNDENAEDICRWILACNFGQNKPQMMNLIINSEGGSLTSAFSIIDCMNSSIIPIRTIGLGQICSAGLMIFLAGTKGERILTPNTCILSHQYHYGSSGKHHELVAIQKEFGFTFERQLNHYVKRTGLKAADVKKYLLPPEDVFLNAEEALKYGICDKVALI